MTIDTSPQGGCPPAVTELDREAARAAISAVAKRFAALLRGIDNTKHPARGTAWTVGETAAHVLVVINAFSAAIDGQPQALVADQIPDADFPTRLAACNASTIAMVDHSDAARIAEMITVATQRFLRLTAAAHPDQECATPWYGRGRTRTVDCLIALALGELTVHGHDIATGTGRPWHIPTEHAQLIVGTVCPNMSPLTVRSDACRGASVVYEIRLRANGPRYVLEVADGKVEVRPAGEPVDCVISARPVTFLLVAYGRLPLYRAFIRGGIVSTGRRPWLGLRFKALFYNP